MSIDLHEALQNFLFAYLRTRSVLDIGVDGRENLGRDFIEEWISMNDLKEYVVVNRKYVNAERNLSEKFEPPRKTRQYPQQQQILREIEKIGEILNQFRLRPSQDFLLFNALIAVRRKLLVEYCRCRGFSEDIVKDLD